MQRQLRNESKYVTILVSDGSYSQRIYTQLPPTTNFKAMILVKKFTASLLKHGN